MASKLDEGDGGEISDINVTPFVDVVLVLLVIFMVATPALIQESLKIELPKASSTDGTPPNSLGIVITKSGQILVDGVLSDAEALSQSVKAALQKDKSTQALIAADQDSAHRDLVRVIDLLKQAGLEKFALEVKRNEEATP